MRASILALGAMFICAGCSSIGGTVESRLVEAKTLFERKAYSNAVSVLGKLLEDKSASPGMCAEALYWKAESLAAQGDLTNAYLTAKQLVWQFPETKWASRYTGKLPIWDTGNKSQQPSAGDVRGRTPEK